MNLSFIHKKKGHKPKAPANQPTATPAGTGRPPRPGRPPNTAATTITTRPTSFALPHQPGGGASTEPRSATPRQAPALNPTDTYAPTEQLLTERQMIERCEQAFWVGPPQAAIDGLDGMLESTADTGLQHRLLAELTQALLSNDNDDVQPGTCAGIGQAIQEMAKSGWMLPEDPFYLEPRVRDILRRLSDPPSAFVVIDCELNVRFAQAHAHHLTTPDDVEYLLDRLHLLHDLVGGADEGPRLVRVLAHAQRLFDRLARLPEAARAPLRQRCLRLIEQCLTPTRLRALRAIRSQLELTAHVDAATGQWTWASIEYPKKALLPSQARKEEVRFFSDIERLLQGPQPVPWALVVNVIVAALKTHHWVPDYGVLLSWTLQEARRGNTAPMVQQLMKIEEELGTDGARHQLFLCLGGQLQAGMPWLEMTTITDAVREQCHLALSAKNEWALHVLCAQVGDARPMIDLLRSDLPGGFVDRERLNQLLALCESHGGRWKAMDLAALIAAIRPHLGDEPDLGAKFAALLPAQSAWTSH